MDPIDFDSLSRTFAEALSRRRLTGLIGSLPLAALLSGLASSVSEARRQRHGARHTFHSQKKKKKKKKTKKPAVPPVSPGSPPVPPPPPPSSPTCPQAAAPNFCTSASACVPACPSGRVFDSASCKCVCVEQACCYCTCPGGSPLACLPSGATTQAGCRAGCAAFCDASADFITYSFAGGQGSNAECDTTHDTCVVTCQAETVCGTRNQCTGLSSEAACGSGAFCTQPFGGGPTRCSTNSGLTSMAACNCTSHQGCVDLFGQGTFCADTTGCNTPCSGHTMCARSA
jgi:hypothetical protein